MKVFLLEWLGFMAKKKKPLLRNKESDHNSVDFSKDSVAQEDRGLIMIAIIMVIGLVAILFVSYWIAANRGKGMFWSITGLSCLIGLSAMLSGGFLGFLFGIPRSLQRRNPEAETASEPGRSRTRPYGNNTNLEEISDWLTKIIVGVSLTQLPAIERRFDLITKSAADGFWPYIPSYYSYPYTACLITFYMLCGFLAVYLWAKIYLLKQLTILESSLEDLSNLKKQNKEQNFKIKVQDFKIEIAKIESQLKEFDKQKKRVKIVESDPQFKEIIEKSKPGTISFLDDSQKGRWGGSPVVDGYQLKAKFSKMDEADEVYDIELAVTSSGGTQLEGAVYFFLHDSYYPDCIRKVQADNGSASITISSYEAFTVAAVCNEGAVKLELDLNADPEAPEDYRYTDKLLTYDELMTRLEDLINQKEIEENKTG